jgi:hypothetical protein
MQFPPPWVSLGFGPRPDRNAAADTDAGTDAATGTHRHASRPLALAALGVALLAITTGGVRATLSAIAEGDTPTVIASGTLLLELADDGDGLTASLGDLAPGDSVDRFVDLTNAGTLDAGELTVAITASGDAVLVDDGDAPATTRALTLAVDACDGTWDTAASTCAGTTDALLAATTIGTLDDSPASLGLAFAPAETVHLRLRFMLPDQDEESRNGVPPSPTIQDASVDVTVTFRVEQRDATSTSS